MEVQRTTTVFSDEVVTSKHGSKTAKTVAGGAVKSSKVFGAAASNKPRRALGTITNAASKQATKAKKAVGQQSLTRGLNAGSRQPLRRSKRLKTTTTTKTRSAAASSTAAVSSVSVHVDGVAPMSEVESAAHTAAAEPTTLAASTAAGPAPILSSIVPPGVTDIDADDADVPMMASEYVTDIYCYLREHELRFAVSPDFLNPQPAITVRMRSILVNWLVEVHHRFELLQETLYMTVNLVDRFLARKEVPRSKLQLVGVTSMLIACKYEEMYPPEVGDFVFITDNAYTRQQILAMEQLILGTIDFALGQPLPLHFLRRNSKAGGADVKMHTIAKYLMELTLGEANMLGYLPSQIAASALYISRDILRLPDVWNATLVHYSGYEPSMIVQCIQDLRQVLRNAHDEECTEEAVRTKYTKQRYMSISKDAALLSYAQSSHPTPKA
eukprot:m.376 g.376  ORF g.376 m.376 type:complete len:441 (-) comp133_c0_seq1:178-1500(-)